MKKVLSFALIVCTGLTLFACSGPFGSISYGLEGNTFSTENGREFEVYKFYDDKGRGNAVDENGNEWNLRVRDGRVYAEDDYGNEDSFNY